MKKTIIFTLLLIFSISVQAQNMNFMGKHLGCSFEIFKQRMVENGLNYLGKETFKGSFEGDPVRVMAYKTPKTNVVYQVIVIYDNYVSNPSDRQSVNRQKTKLNDLKNAIKKQYGAPRGEDDEGALWLFNFGEIFIHLGDIDGTRISISYLDASSEAKYKAEGGK